MAFGKGKDPAAPRAQRGCCAGCSRAVCGAILAALFVCICGLSVAALVGRRQYWSYFTTNPSDPGAYNIKTGWLDFSTRDTDSASLNTVNFGLWIIGAICAATLLLSAGVAFVEFFLAVTNRCGRHTAGLAFLIGLVLLGILICYLVAAIIEFRSWTNTNAGQAYSVWPTWGWICALVASILWLLAASAASCMGLRHPKQLPSYQQPAPAAYPAAAGAAPAKPRRGLFGRRQAVPSTATAPTPTQEYTAQPFDQAHPGRDVEMGAQPGTGMGKTNGHAGEAAAAGVAGGTAAGLAGDRHRTTQPGMGQAPMGAGREMDAPPKRRGLFGGGFGRKRAAANNEAPLEAQQTYPTHQPAGAGIGSAPTSPAVADRERGVDAPHQANTPGGAWAGSQLASQDAEQRGAWAGSGNRATDVAAEGDPPMTDVPLNNEPAVNQPARMGRASSGKKGIFSFYH